MALTTKKNGFTLIEMMVVVFILSLFAYMAAPYLVANRDNERRRTFYTDVLDLAGRARELSIEQDATMYLALDTTTNAINLVQESDTTNYAGTSNDTSNGNSTMVINGHVQSTRTQSNIGTNQLDHSQDKTLKTINLVSGIQFGNLQLAGKSIDSGSWKVHFYADGTCDGGGIEFTKGSVTRTMVINARGGAQMVDGTMPDTSQDSWAAGDYVHRQQ